MTNEESDIKAKLISEILKGCTAYEINYILEAKLYKYLENIEIECAVWIKGKRNV